MRRTMAAMAEQPFHMFQHQQQSYPEPPQHAFTSPPMDMGLTADAAFGAGFPRSGQDAYPAATPMGFEASLYADTPNYILNGRASPGSYHDDSDMRLPSSSLSSASA